jgi:hypothetical protein
MARDFEDIHDLDNLSPDELRELVRTHLEAHNMMDVDDINVHVEKGQVRLLGRVGTEAEARVAERVVTDTLGFVNVSNELVVDALRRAESPMAIDEHLANEDRTEGLLLGDMPPQQEDGVSEVDDEELDDRLFGSTDVQSTISKGVPWIPPESPTPEGLGGTDGTSGMAGEDH